MPRLGPEKRLRDRLRKELLLKHPHSTFILLVDAYRTGCKRCDFLWMNKGLLAAVELKANRYLNQCLFKTTELQRKSLVKLARSGLCVFLVCEELIRGKLHIFKVSKNGWGFANRVVIEKSKEGNRIFFDLLPLWKIVKKHYKKELKWIIKKKKKISSLDLRKRNDSI
jgi:hypothetical protein